MGYRETGQSSSSINPIIYLWSMEAREARKAREEVTCRGTEKPCSVSEVMAPRVVPEDFMGRRLASSIPASSVEHNIREARRL